MSNQLNRFFVQKHDNHKKETVEESEVNPPFQFLRHFFVRLLKSEKKHCFALIFSSAYMYFSCWIRI